MADFCQFFMNFSWNSLLLGQCILGGEWEGHGGGVGGGKSLNKEKEDTNSRVQSSYDVYMHPQRANIPLQGLDRRALTVGAISGPHSQLGALFGAISPVVDLHGQQKAFKEVTLASGGSEHA